jgi:hypothetical protein
VYRTEDNISRRQRNKCVLFHRESLPPPSLCISFIPFTVELKKNAKIDRNITVTLKGRLTMTYKTEEELHEDLKILQTFSNYTNMDFGLDKILYSRKDIFFTRKI